MISFNDQAVKDFLNPPTSFGRLIIEKGNLHYVDKSSLSSWTLFTARLGFGKAAASNVTKFINANRQTLFANMNDIIMFNQKIINYNNKRTLCWKKAKLIKGILVKNLSVKMPSVKSIKPVKVPSVNIPPQQPPKASPVVVAKPADPIKPLAEIIGDINAITCALAECKIAFKNLDPTQESTVINLLDQCIMLSYQVENLVIIDKAIDANQFEIQDDLLNEVMNFKNEVRAACIDKGKKVLKGPKTAQNKLLTKDQQATLKESLKHIRKNILTKYFAERLDKDKRQLVQLQTRFLEVQALPQFSAQKDFLQSQLDYWQKKNDQGKPIAVPKWYHCTPKADILDKILNTDLLYMGQCYPGVFMANLPEVEKYGAYCIVMSDYVEYTGTHAKDANGDFKDDFIMPGYTGRTDKSQITFIDDIFDDGVIRKQANADIKDNQEGVNIWLGLQIGKETFDPITKIGTAGVPINGEKRLQTDKPLRDYYADTTVAFVMNRDKHDANLVAQISDKHRFQALSLDKCLALRDLVNTTYICTLPKAWENMQSLVR